MKDRCYNKNLPKYPIYGGRGITICDEWLDDFMVFYNWAMENGYEKGLSIERIDVNGDYKPSNCTWITMGEQARNKRCSRIVEYKGEKILLLDLLERLGKVDEYSKINNAILRTSYDIETILELPDGKLERGKYFFKKYLYDKLSKIENGSFVKRSVIYKEVGISSATLRKYLNEKDIEQILYDLNITVSRYDLTRIDKSKGN